MHTTVVVSAKHSTLSASVTSGLHTDVLNRGIQRMYTGQNWTLSRSRLMADLSELLSCVPLSTLADGVEDCKSQIFVERLSTHHQTLDQRTLLALPAISRDY